MIFQIDFRVRRLIHYDHCASPSQTVSQAVENEADYHEINEASHDKQLEEGSDQSLIEEPHRLVVMHNPLIALLEF